MVSMTCEKCNGNSVKSRTNYTHGKKSSSTTTLTCKKCGSANINVSAPSYGRGRR